MLATPLPLATPVQESIILRIPGRQREHMQELNPHDSYQLLLTVFRQIEASALSPDLAP